MDTTLKLGDLAIVFATFFGPIAAVQVQKFLDRRGERNRRQVEVFRALMANRLTSNSPQYVNALNAVPLEFHENKKVMDAWKDLLLHLNSNAKAKPEVWGQRRTTLANTLLKIMGDFLHYGFREAEIHDHAYFPEWQLMIMNDQELVRKGLVDLMTGKASLPMTVKEFPGDPELARSTTELQTLLIEWLEGKRTPAVTTTPTEAPTK